MGADGITVLKVSTEEIDLMSDLVFLQSVEGLRAVTGQLTAIGQKQLYQLGRQLRSELIEDAQQPLLPPTYDPKYV